MKRSVKAVVRHCTVCIAVKGRQIRKEEMAPADRPPALGDRWHLDGLNLPPSMGYDHLIVATDVATKYVLLSKSIGETAQAASSLLMRICHTFGRPKQMTTDQGRANISNLFMTVCHDNGIQFKPVGIKKNAHRETGWWRELIAPSSRLQPHYAKAGKISGPRT